MNDSALMCTDERRRAAVRAEGRLNGIDYIEVEPIDAAHPQPVLQLYTLGALDPDGPLWNIEITNIRVEGGRRITDLAVVKVEIEQTPGTERDDILHVTLDKEGDQSPYTLHLEGSAEAPLEGIDPRYRSAPFRFVPTTPVEIDCVTAPACPPPESTVPDLNYLAKDYASFRQLLLDRLAVTLPDWRERSTPDLYLTIVEILAYAADHLSYAQDAVATEAYLDTARLRVSIRRHARLVDYAMHDGCNARAWVCVEVDGDPEIPVDALAFITRPQGIDPGSVVVLADELRPDVRASYEVFEPMITEWAEIIERDIINPRELARRLLTDQGPQISEIRSRLSAETRAELERAGGPNEDLPLLLSTLAELLNELLNDPGLTLGGRGSAAWAAALHGTPNALRGDCLCRHNRRRIHEMFPTEIAQLARLRFHETHNRIRFYTWNQAECCLPSGATSATLLDAWRDDSRKARALEHLRVGDVLILEEVVNPRTGSEADVDPAHRHAVRLVSVVPLVDPLCDVPVVEITWAPADALPFPLVLSAIGPAPECALLEDLGITHGNVVLVDHGETVREPNPARLRDGVRTLVAVPFDAPYDRVPAEDIELCCVGEGWLSESPMRAARYEPRLSQAPLVFSESLSQPLAPATITVRQDPHRALPQVMLFSPVDLANPWLDVVQRLPDASMPHPQPMPYERWRPYHDLLTSGAADRRFVVEIDDDGAAHLRFGDGQLGAPPEPDTRFLAAYRTGGGPAGNVGRESITHLVLRGEIRGGEVCTVRNPLPARGGTAPEPVAEVRLRAPHAFRSVLMRAITTEDYAAIVLRDFGDRIQRADARIDGSAITVSIDPIGSTTDDTLLMGEVERHIQWFRRIGHIVDVRQVEYVPLELTITARVLPYFQHGALRGALRDRFSNRQLADGTRGFFHPDALTFGQDIPLSALVAAGQAVPGVGSLTVSRLRRKSGGPEMPDDDLLKLESWEIARLDNDPDFPEHGVLTIELEDAV